NSALRLLIENSDEKNEMRGGMRPYKESDLYPQGGNQQPMERKICRSGALKNMQEIKELHNERCINDSAGANFEIDTEKQNKARALIFKVKTRLSSTQKKYRMFLEIIHRYQLKKLTGVAVIEQLEKLIGNHPDIIKDFVEFMPEQLDSQEDVIEKIKNVLKSKDIYADFLKCLNLKTQELISDKDFITLMRPLIEDAKLIDGLKKYIGYSEVENEDDKGSVDELKGNVGGDVGKKIGSYKIISDDSKQWDIDHHYNGLEEQSVLRRKVRTKNMFDKNANLKITIIDSLKSNDFIVMNDDIINTLCISVPTLFSEDSDFNHHRRNYFEETIYRAEEERYEYEILIEKIQTLIENLECVLPKLNTKNNELSIEDFDMPGAIINEILTYIYNKQGEEIFDEILNNPEAAIPVVLNRLYRVIEQWKKEYRSRGECWRDVVNQNYFKALDVLGYQFKIDEKKRNSQRSVRQEFETGIVFDILNCNQHEKNFNDLHAQVADVLFLKLKNSEDKSSKPRFMKKTLFLIEKILEMLKRDAFQIKVDFHSALLFRHILRIFEKINFLKTLPIKKIEINEIAVNLGYDIFRDYQKHNDLIEVLLDYLRGDLEAIDFANISRILSDWRGYKILTIDKILDRIYKTASGLNAKAMNKYFNEGNHEEEGEREEDLYLIDKKGPYVAIRAKCNMQNNEIENCLDKMSKMEVDKNTNPVTSL
ncbi:Paired amphipathic helix protein Sin3-like 6, partial [Dictyocoela roeselum]